ncbi:hypothetical protein ACFLXU_06850 [Chloroflexota bacterium]
MVSMARTVNPYENVLTGLVYFIEEVYNPKRLHSTLDYRSPNDFEEFLP